MLRRTEIGVGYCIQVCWFGVVLNLLYGHWREGRLWLKCLYDSPHFGCLPELQRLLGLHLSLIVRVKYECQITNASSVSLSARCCCCCRIPAKNGKQAAKGVTNRHSLLGVGLFNPQATNVIYIYIYIYMEHPFLMFLDHTQRRSTVGRTPLDE